MGLWVKPSNSEERGDLFLVCLSVGGQVVLHDP